MKYLLSNKSTVYYFPYTQNYMQSSLKDRKFQFKIILILINYKTEIFIYHLLSLKILFTCFHVINIFNYPNKYFKEYINTYL